MYPRTNYEMTEDDLKELLDACKPTPVMFLSGGRPIGGTPQENANRAWKNLGEKMGFDYMTVRSINGKGDRFFSAVPSENETQMAERLEREAEEQRQVLIKQLEIEIGKKQNELRKLQGGG
jgi:hypothetical protein